MKIDKFAPINSCTTDGTGRHFSIPVRVEIASRLLTGSYSLLTTKSAAEDALKLADLLIDLHNIDVETEKAG